MTTNPYIKMRFYIVLTTSIILTGCGGGDSEGASGLNSNEATTSTFSTKEPVKLANLPIAGTPSDKLVLDNLGQSTVQLLALSFNYNFYPPAIYNLSATKTINVPTFNYHHLTDSKANSAWADGWTGKGSIISIIDDFDNKSVNLTYTQNNVARGLYYSETYSPKTYQATYSNQYKWNQAWSHGDLVSNIAGSDFDMKPVPLSKDIQQSSSKLVDCSSGGFPSTICPAISYNVSGQSAVITYKSIPGVAPESVVIENNVDLSSDQDPISTVSTVQGHLKNSINGAVNVINLSIGADIPTSGRTTDEVMKQVNLNPISGEVDSVIVVAAGNNGLPCANDDLAGCNSIAIAMAFQSATKNSTIIAGALSGSGTDENIATYSTRAGVLANRFLLAQGYDGLSGRSGTSFAAPRISGAAAILKQKYPNLKPEQIADILLLSANKDITNSGSPLFTGVHPIYGHGKLDLPRALSLANSIK